MWAWKRLGNLPYFLKISDTQVQKAFLNIYFCPLKSFLQILSLFLFRILSINLILLSPVLSNPKMSYWSGSLSLSFKSVLPNKVVQKYLYTFYPKIFGTTISVNYIITPRFVFCWGVYFYNAFGKIFAWEKYRGHYIIVLLRPYKASEMVREPFFLDFSQEWHYRGPRAHTNSGVNGHVKFWGEWSFYLGIVAL